jgi:hypothetical protein
MPVGARLFLGAKVHLCRGGGSPGMMGDGYSAQAGMDFR